jgi:G3E family GTPase
VIRSKGYFWLATRPGLAGSWSQAGPMLRHELGGLWWAAVAREDWPQDEDSRRIIHQRWVEPYGDAQRAGAHRHQHGPARAAPGI